MINAHWLEEKKDSPKMTAIVSHYLLAKAARTNGNFELESMLNELRVYDETACTYLENSGIFESDSHEFVYSRHNAIKVGIEIVKPHTVVNFGCGYSPLGLLLSHNYNVIDADFSEIIKDRPLAKHGRYQLSETDFSLGSIGQITNEFDGLVTFEGVFYYFNKGDLMSILSEIKKGFISDFFIGKRNDSIHDPTDPFSNIEELTDFVEQNGFSYQPLGQMNQYQVVLLCQRKES